MATESFGYDIEVVSQHYAKYRPTYQPELYEKILKYVDEGSEGNRRRGLAVDVGCGGGQSTLALAKHFENVIGIDSSETQLIEAEKASVDYRNVVYKQAMAEDLSSAVATESADLVTVGIAIHWFDMEKFYTEAKRILKRGEGVLAVYTYTTIRWQNQDAEKLINSFFLGTFKKYWQEEVNHVFDGYIVPWTLLPDFFDQCIRDESMSHNFNFNLGELIGFMKSFPQYIHYKTEHPEHPDELDLIIERLKDLFGTDSMEEKVLQGYSPIYLLLGRKF